MIPIDRIVLGKGLPNRKGNFLPLNAFQLKCLIEDIFHTEGQLFYPNIDNRRGKHTYDQSHGANCSTKKKVHLHIRINPLARYISLVPNITSKCSHNLYMLLAHECIRVLIFNRKQHFPPYFDNIALSMYPECTKKRSAFLFKISIIAIDKTSQLVFLHMQITEKGSKCKM